MVSLLGCVVSVLHRHLDWYNILTCFRAGARSPASTRENVLWPARRYLCFLEAYLLATSRSMRLKICARICSYYTNIVLNFKLKTTVTKRLRTWTLWACLVCGNGWYWSRSCTNSEFNVVDVSNGPACHLWMMSEKTSIQLWLLSCDDTSLKAALCPLAPDVVGMRYFMISRFCLLLYIGNTSSLLFTYLFVQECGNLNVYVSFA